MRLGSLTMCGLVTAALVVMGACGSEERESAPRSVEPSVQETEEQRASDASVKVIDTDFKPVSVTVEVGSTVDWEQVGDQPHSVSAVDGSFDSSPGCGPIDSERCLGQGDTFSHIFEKPGEFTYYCRVHGLPDGAGMVGTVIVR